jgi:hypothetical protein
MEILFSAQLFLILLGVTYFAKLLRSLHSKVSKTSVAITQALPNHELTILDHEKGAAIIAPR